MYYTGTHRKKLLTKWRSISKTGGRRVAELRSRLVKNRELLVGERKLLTKIVRKRGSC